MRHNNAHIRLAPTVLALVLTALLVTLVAIPISAAQASTPTISLSSAWNRARALGAYQFRSQMQVVSDPLPVLENVGLSSKEQQFYLTGSVDTPNQSMQVKLWSSDQDQPLEMRFANGAAEGRAGYSDWQKLPISSDLFAPGSDPLGWLSAARDVQEAGSESLQGVRATRYTFAIDGPRFAQYTTDQLADRYRRQGVLPAGTSITAASTLVDLSGTGEIWLSDEGLPLRQMLKVSAPNPGQPERTNATITSDFSGFPQASALRSVVSAAAHIDWRNLGMNAAVLLAGFGIALVLIRRARSRALRNLVTIVMVSLFLVQPLLQESYASTVSARVKTMQTEATQAGNARAATAEHRAARAKPAFDPARSPLQQTNPPASRSTTTDDQLVGDSGVDSDNDGLTDVQETTRLHTDKNKADTDGDGLRDDVEVLELGTSPTNPDTDGDGIPDGVEVAGFKDAAGKQWYLDPLSDDTNNDGRNDLADCVVSGQRFCPDSDGDGIPDPFDADDDQDGVPDAVDTAPTAFIGAGRDSNPTDPRAKPLASEAFSYSVDSFQPGQPLTVDFQIRPSNPDTLWYNRQVFDWPSDDRQGQVQRVRDTTFGASGKDANGDMRLLPMLEIELPKFEDAFATLPRRTGAPSIMPALPLLAGKTTEARGQLIDAWLDSWLDRDMLRESSVNLRVTNSGSGMLAYVPVNTVRDPISNSPVAYSGRMVYAPGAGTFGGTHKLRLAWTVDAIQDACSAAPAANDAKGEAFKAGWSKLSDAERYNAWCADLKNWTSFTGPIATYYDRFLLSGLNVTEDRGAKIAYLGQKTTTGSSLFPNHLWNLALNLDRTFVAGSARLKLESVANRNWPAEWGIPNADISSQSATLANTAELGTYSVPFTRNGVMQEPLISKFLNETYLNGDNTARVDTPTLLFLREMSERSVGLEQTSTGASYTLSFSGAQASTSVTMNLMPYRYKGARVWEQQPLDAYWSGLEPVFKGLLSSYGGTVGGNDDALAGSLLIARTLALSLNKGSARLVRLDDLPLIDQAQIPADKDLARPSDPAQALGQIVEAMANRVSEAQRLSSVVGPGGTAALLGAIGARERSNASGEGLAILGGARVAPTSAGDGTLTFGAMGAIRTRMLAPPRPDLPLAMAMTDMQAQIQVAKGVLPSYGLFDKGAAAWSAYSSGALTTPPFVPAVRALKPPSLNVGSIFRYLKQFAGTQAFGIILAVALPTLTLGYSLISGDVKFGTLQFSEQLADTLAQIAVALVLVVLTATLGPLGSLIGAAFAAIDYVISSVCQRAGISNDPNKKGFVKDYLCAGISKNLAKLIKYLIFAQTPLVKLDTDNRINPTNWDVQLLDPQTRLNTGFLQGNELRLRADVITTLERNSPSGIGYGHFYMFQNDNTIRDSTFRYDFDTEKRTGGAALQNNPRVQLSLMQRDWRQRGSDTFVATQSVDSGSKVLIKRPGINWKPDGLYLAEGYATFVQECWTITCNLREKKESTYLNLADSFVFDTFPKTIGEFANRTTSDGGTGYRLSWDDKFPTLKDGDGDGLRSRAVGGNDPDDNTPDTDGDGLSDFYELQNAARGFNPKAADTDGDGLSDYDEARYGTNPALADSDNDGLKDGDEIVRVVRDSSGVARTVGGWEIVYAYDSEAKPLYTRVGSDPLRADTDSDGIPDREERTYGFNPRVFNKAQVLSVVANLDERDGLQDGVIRPGQLVGVSTSVVNELRNRYALSRSETSLGDARLDKSYILSPREATTISQDIRIASLSQSQKLDLATRATAIIADLRALADGRVLWLHLDDTNGKSFADDSLLGNAAICQSNCPGSDSGYQGRSLVFNAGQSLVVPYKIALNLSRFSLSMWVRPSIVNGYQDLITRQKGPGDRFNYALSLPPNSLKLRIAAQAADCRTIAVDIFSNLSLTAGSWNHILASYDGTKVQLYINGVPDASKDIPSGLCESDAGLRIGDGLNGTALDEISLYPRALTDAEARAFYRDPLLALDFDGSIADRSALNHTIVSKGVGAPVIAPIRSDESAASFDKRRWLSVGAMAGGNPGLNLNVGLGQFTLAGWLRPAPIARAYDSDLERWMGVMGNKQSDNDANAYPSLFVSDRGALKVEFGNGSVLCSSGSTGNTTVQDNAWQHVAVAYDGQRFHFYVDGVERSTLSLSSNCSGNPRPAQPSDKGIYVGRADAFTRTVLERIDVKDEGDGPGNAEYRLTYAGYLYENSDVDKGILQLNKVHTYYGDQTNQLELLEMDGGLNGDNDVEIRENVSNTSATVGKRHTRYNADGEGYLDWIVENQFFNGDLDDLRIFRYALNADEAKLLSGARTSDTTLVNLSADEPPFQTRFRDSSGNSRVALCREPLTTCPESGLPGVIGQGLRFDGTDKIEVNSNPSMNSALGQAFTAAAWVNLVNPQDDQKVLSKADIVAKRGFVLGVKNGQVFGELWDAAGNYVSASGGSVPANTWVHVALTAYVGGELQVFLNGQRVGGASINSLSRVPAAFGAPAALQNPVLYDDVNYQGARADLGTGSQNGFLSTFNDRASSMRTNGACVELYDNSNYDGLLAQSCEDVNWLRNAQDPYKYQIPGTNLFTDVYANDRASSVRIHRTPLNTTKPGEGVYFDYKEFQHIVVNKVEQPDLQSFSFATEIKPEKIDNDARRAQRFRVLQSFGNTFEFGMEYKNDNTWILRLELTLNDKKTAYESLSGASMDGKWHQVAVTYDQRTIRFYIDGQLAGATTAVGLNFPKNSGVMIIGRTASCGLTFNTAGFQRSCFTSLFHGAMRNVALYARPLEQNELATFFSNPSRASTAGQVLVMPLDEPAGKTTFDRYVTNPLGTNNLPLTVGQASWGGLGVNGRIDEVRLAPFAIGKDELVALAGRAPALTLPLDEAANVNDDRSANATIFANTANAALAGACAPPSCPATGSQGRIREAAIFDGVDDMVEVPSSDNLKLNTYTIAMWVKPEGVRPREQPILTKANPDTTSRNYGLFILPNSLRVSISGQKDDCTTWFGLDSTRLLNPGQWNHLAATYDGSTLSLYINGTLDSSKALSGRLCQNNQPLRLGREPNAPKTGSPFAGALDEVSVFGRAMSARQLMDLYTYQDAWFDATARVAVTVDADKPDVRLDLSGDAVIGPGDVRMAIVASDKTSAITKVEYNTNTDGTWREASRDRNVWVFTFTSNPIGGFYNGSTINVRATDAVGNVQESSRSFQVDFIGPNISSTSVQAIQRPLAAADNTWALGLRGSASDDSGPVKLIARILDRDGSTLGQPLVVPAARGDWSGSYRFGFAPNGNYTLMLSGVDRAGNAVEKRYDIALDATAPTADVLVGGQALAGAGGPLSPPLPTLTGSVTDLPVPFRPVLAAHFEGGAELGRRDGSERQRVLDCTASNCPSFGQVGRLGNAATFDGNDDTLATEDLTLRAAPNERQPFTIAGWLNPSEVRGTIFLAEQADGPAVKSAVQIQASGSDIVARLNDGTLREIARGALGSGKWTHVALSYDGQQARLYLNGVLSANSAVAGVFAGFNRANIGGATINGSADYFNGSLDELYIFDHAINAEEVASLANGLSSGVASVEVGLLPLAQRDNPGAISWSQAALTANGLPITTWSLALPAGIEGPHQIYLRTTDSAGNQNVLPGVWTGEIDTKAPGLSFVNAPADGGAANARQVSCRATDLNLSKSGLECPVAAALWRERQAVPFSLIGVDGKIVDAPKRLREIEAPLTTIEDTGNGLKLRACDRFNNCAELPGAAALNAAAGSKGLALTAGARSATFAGLNAMDPGESIILAPAAGKVFTTTSPIAISGYARADANIINVDVTAGGNTIASLPYPGTSTTVNWNTTYTPSTEGRIPLQAIVTAVGGAIFTDTLAPAILIDLSPPQVSLATQTISRGNLSTSGELVLTGAITESTDVTAVEVSLDGGAWFNAAPGPLSFPAANTPFSATLAIAPFDRDEPFSMPIAVRVTDSAGRQAVTTGTVQVDTQAPFLDDLRMSYDDGGTPVEIFPGDTITDTTSPALTLSWTPADGSGISQYRVVVTNQASLAPPVETTIVDTTLPGSATSYTFTGSEAQNLSFTVTAIDIYGNAAPSSFGPFTIDSGRTPTYSPLVLPNPANLPPGTPAVGAYVELYRGFLDDGCSAIGTDQRLRFIGDDPDVPAQRLYTTWNSDALRVTWQGGNWDTDGDLFIYLDTKANAGATDAYNPFGAAGGKVRMPNDMRPDFAIWVSSAYTATLLTWDGTAWQPSPLTSYHFDASQDTPTTDISLNFAALGITNPTATSLGLLAFASDEGNLRPWATLPSNNPLASSRASTLHGAAEALAGDGLALRNAYTWASLGSGVCPGEGLYDPADIVVELEPQTPGLVSSELDDLYWQAAGSDPERNDAVLPTVAEGQQLSYTVRYLNQGNGTSQNLRFELPDGTTHLIGDVSAGANGEFNFTWTVPAATPADPISLWVGGNLGVYDEGGSASNSDWLDLITFEHQVDRDPPHAISVQTPAVLRNGENVIAGAVGDYSAVPTITLELQGLAGITTISCVNPSPENGNWSCPLNVSGANDGQVVQVRARATDIHGLTSDWSAWWRMTVDAAGPSVSFDDQSVAAVDDGVLGPEEATLSGRVTDLNGISDVVVCDNDSGECKSAEVELDDAPVAANVRLTDTPPNGTLGLAGLAACSAGTPFVRTFVVSDSLTVAGANLTLTAGGLARGTTQVSLRSPLGTTVVLNGRPAADSVDGEGFNVRFDDLALLRA